MLYLLPEVCSSESSTWITSVDPCCADQEFLFLGENFLSVLYYYRANQFVLCIKYVL